MYYADPLFVDVPLAELLSGRVTPIFAGRLLRRDPAPRWRNGRGDPRRGQPLLAEAEARRGFGWPGPRYDYFVVADRWGNVVVATPSGWSGVQAGDTGVWLGTRLQSFNTWPEHPNCIEPGKRPRITLTPTLVLKGGKPLSGR